MAIQKLDGNEDPKAVAKTFAKVLNFGKGSPWSLLMPWKTLQKFETFGELRLPWFALNSKTQPQLYL
jgi:hypothetical protein